MYGKKIGKQERSHGERRQNSEFIKASHFMQVIRSNTTGGEVLSCTRLNVTEQILCGFMWKAT